MSSTRLLCSYLNGACFWVGLLAVAIGIACLAAAYTGHVGTAEGGDEFAERGVSAVARVIQKGERIDWVGEKLRPVYRVRYQFVDHEGAERQGVADISEASWKQSRIGQPLLIRYLRDDPSNSWAVDRQLPGSNPVRLLLLASGALLTLGGGLSVANDVWRALRRTRVVQIGEPSVARVTEVLLTERGRRIRIGYVFTDGRGKPRDGQTRPLHERFAGRWNVGDAILVLCRNDDLFHHEVDVYGARLADLTRLLSGVQGRN